MSVNYTDERWDELCIHRKVHRDGAQPPWPLRWRSLDPINLAYNKLLCQKSC